MLINHKIFPLTPKPFFSRKIACVLVLAYLPCVWEELTDYFISKVKVPASDGQRSLVFHRGINAAKSCRVLNLQEYHNKYTQQNSKISLSPSSRPMQHALARPNIIGYDVIMMSYYYNDTAQHVQYSHANIMSWN